MPTQIRVAVLDNHQSIIDGYIYRLTLVPSIQIAASAVFGEVFGEEVFGEVAMNSVHHQA